MPTPSHCFKVQVRGHNGQRTYYVLQVDGHLTVLACVHKADDPKDIAEQMLTAQGYTIRDLGDCSDDILDRKAFASAREVSVSEESCVLELLRESHKAADIPPGRPGWGYAQELDYEIQAMFTSAEDLIQTNLWRQANGMWRDNTGRTADSASTAARLTGGVPVIENEFTATGLLHVTISGKDFRVPHEAVEETVARIQRRIAISLESSENSIGNFELSVNQTQLTIEFAEYSATEEA